MNLIAETTKKCPICRSEVVCRFIKPRLYVEQDLDIDLYPRKISWLQGGCGKNPRLYFMQLCNNCSFVVPHQVIEDPFKNTGVSLERFGDALQYRRITDRKAKNITDILTSKIGDMDYYAALKLHLLAIYQLENMGGVRDLASLQLGRYLLRTAWLYRDVLHSNKLEATYMPRIEEMHSALAEYWDEAPLNERMALEKAAGYYMKAFSHSGQINDAHEEMRLLTLVARIQLKLMDLDAAHKMITICQDKVMRFDRDMKEAANPSARKGGAKKADPEILNQMRADSLRMKKLLDDVRDIHAEMKRAEERRKVEEARMLLEEYEEAPAEQKRAVLQQAGVDGNIILKVVPEKKKKKGLFGF